MDHATPDVVSEYFSRTDERSTQPRRTVWRANRITHKCVSQARPFYVRYAAIRSNWIKLHVVLGSLTTYLPPISSSLAKGVISND
jgi:hypothetical protein